MLNPQIISCLIGGMPATLDDDFFGEEAERAKRALEAAGATAVTIHNATVLHDDGEE